MQKTTSDDGSTNAANSTESGFEVSRDPSDYRPVDHYLIRARRDFGPTSETRTNPPITPKVTRTCITEGRIEDAQGDCTKFIAEVEGCEWHLITSGDLVLTAFARDRHDPADVLMGVRG